MKKTICLVLIMLLILALGGCASEGQALYEKYAPIIDMLEAKDYQGAIRDITAMAIEEQRGDVVKVPVMQVLCDTWHTVSNGAPTTLAFNEDGTCSIGGEAMTWLATESDSENYLRVQVSKDGNICRIISLDTSYVVPYLSMSFAEQRDDGIYSGEHIGYYYNHPLMPYLLRSWYGISPYEMVGQVENFSLGTNSASVNGDSCNWKLTNSEDDSFLQAHIDAKNEREGSYTLKLTMRDGHPVVYFTDDATGETGMYYNGNHDGYEQSWPEFIYVEALENYNDYLEYGSFYCNISGQNYYDSDDNALSYLYDQLVAIGDYGDAAEILANWDAVKYSRAMRYLTRFENRNTFNIGETYYSWNRETLDFIKGLFEEISSYPEAADVLNNWDAVLFNRANYYLEWFWNHDSFYVDNEYMSWYNMTTVDYIKSQFEEIAGYPEAAAVLADWDSVLYERAMYYLNQYLKGYSFYIGDDYYSGGSTEALSYIYDQFSEIADNSEAQAILDRFTILENVYLYYNYTNLDHMGNVYESGKYYSGYEYNEQGQLIHNENSSELNQMYGRWYYDAYYTYDENGRVTEITIGEYSVEARITPTYDDKGNKISEHIVENNGEFDIFFTYDDQNRLIEMRRPRTDYGDPDKYYNYHTYTYDAAGNLVEERTGYVYYGYVDSETVRTYTYDASGNMVKETEVYTSYTNSGKSVYYTYTHVAVCTCDDRGNVIQKDWTYGNTVYTSGTENRHDYVSATYYYTYGNIYFFDSTGMEPAQ